MRKDSDFKVGFFDPRQAKQGNAKELHCIVSARHNW